MIKSERPPVDATTHQVEPLVQGEHGLVQAGRSAQAADVQLQVVPLAVVDQHLLHAGQSGVFSSVEAHQHTAATQLQRRGASEKQDVQLVQTPLSTSTGRFYRQDRTQLPGL